MQVQHFMYFTFKYLTYFLSFYPFAVQKSDFLYKTASLQKGEDISFHVENKF